MNNLSIILIVLVALTINVNAQKNINKNTEIKRLCYITLDDSSTYKVKNYSLQSIKDRVDYQGGQYIRYIDDNKSKTIFKYDYIWLMIKPGVYQKVKFLDIKKLTLTHRINKSPECEILLKSNGIINGTYRQTGITLDCVSFSFEITKEDGEKIKMPFTWLQKIEKDTSNNERWMIFYKKLPENVTVTNYDAYESVIVPAKNISWVTNKSPIVQTLSKYGENETFNFLNVISMGNELNKNQNIKVKFSDISTIDFFEYGKREFKLVDGTVIKGKFENTSKGYIQYFYGEVDENLIIFAFIFYDRFSLKFE